MGKEPVKFFCEYCGNEVKRNTKICPHCGRFFASIRCPSCGFTGADSDFKEGCPTCGYAVTTQKPSTKKDKRPKNPEPRPQRKKSPAYYAPTNDHNEESLPVWVYLVVVAILVALVAFLFFR